MQGLKRELGSIGVIINIENNYVRDMVENSILWSAIYECSDAGKDYLVTVGRMWLLHLSFRKQQFYFTKLTQFTNQE